MANFTPQQIEEFLQEFFDVVGTRQYIGARYVPLFGRKGETSIEWDDSAPYEPLTIVLWQGDTYTSRQYVPAGVPLDDTDYWAKTGNYNSQVEQYRREVLLFDGRITDLEDSIPPGAFGANNTVKDYIDRQDNETASLIPASQFTPQETVRDYIDEKYGQGTAYTDLAEAKLRDALVPFPVTGSKYGRAGQVLGTLSTGDTVWQDPVAPTDEQAEQYIGSWLDAHPEATTTVTDGSITTEKLADGAVTNPKMSVFSVKSEFDDCVIIHEFASDSLFDNRGYLDGTGTYQDDSTGHWYTSDIIELPTDVDTNGLYLYLCSAGQRTNGTLNVVNCITYWRNDSGQVTRYGIDHNTNGRETYDTVIRLGNNIRAIRFCSIAPDDVTPIFSAFLFKSQDHVLYDGSGLLDGRLFFDAATMLPYAPNGFLSTSGEFVPHAAQTSWFTTDEIDVSNYNTLTYKAASNSGSSVVALYDQYHNIIDNVPYAEPVMSGTLDISAAKYIRCCINVNTNTYQDPTLSHFMVYNRSYLTGDAITVQPPAFHSVNRPYSFSGRNACFCGDSITQGYTGPSAITQDGYPKLFSDSVGMTFVNRGQGGATICRAQGYPCIQDQVTAALASTDTYDFLFIAGGVNDWQTGQTIADFKTALQAICTAILTANFSGEVIFIAPISESGRVPIETPQATLDMFRSATMEVVAENDMSFVNGWLFNFPTVNSSATYRQQMFGDNLHPSELGYQLYARGLRSALC